MYFLNIECRLHPIGYNCPVFDKALLIIRPQIPGLAKENGVSVSFPAEKPQQNFPSADGNDGTDGMMEIAAPESMPTFSRELYGHLPGLLDEVARNTPGKSPPPSSGN